MYSPSIDDPKKNDRDIIQKFNKELCKRENEDNRGINKDPNRQSNVFSTQEIQESVLKAFELKRVLLALIGHFRENRGDEPFEFLDEEKNVRLTDAGRARCDEYDL